MRSGLVSNYGPLQTKANVSPRFGLVETLEGNPLAEILFKDVFGFNLPKLAVTRTWKERLDVATLEFSNTAITLLSSLALPRMFTWVTHKLTKIPIELLNKEIPLKVLQSGIKEFEKVPLKKLMWARAGRSFAFLFPFAAAFWANPFFRNWATAKREKTANFQAIIGLENQDAGKEKRSHIEEARHQMGM